MLTKFNDASLDHVLSIERCPIFRILAEIAELEGAFDLFRQMNPQFIFQVVEFTLQFLFYVLGQSTLTSYAS